MTTETIVWTIDGYVNHPDRDSAFALGFANYVYATQELAQSAAEDRLRNTNFELDSRYPWRPDAIGGFGYTPGNPYSSYTRPVRSRYSGLNAGWIQVERTIIRTDGKY